MPAWTLRFWQAWLYLAVFAASTALVTIDLARRDPALLERRLKGGPAAEREVSQQRIQTVASAMLCALYVVAGFDHRWGWSRTVPDWMVFAADALCAAGVAMIHWTFRENTYTAGIVTVESGQKVIATGPYGVVRHPLYAGAILLFLATPVALGSLWAWLPATALVASVVARLIDEERYLIVHLAGYDEYRRRVRFRLIPGVW